LRKRMSLYLPISCHKKKKRKEKNAMKMRPYLLKMTFIIG